MVYIGMIFQFENSQGEGMIMFSDGEKREFSKNEWVDTLNLPSLGKKVSFEYSGNKVHIKLADSNDDITTAPPEVQKNVQEEITTFIEGFTCVDEYINYYINKGFKLIKDVEVEAVRTLSFRKFDTEPYEVIIKQSASNIIVTQTENGKPIAID